MYTVSQNNIGSISVNGLLIFYIMIISVGKHRSSIVNDEIDMSYVKI